MTDNQIVLCSIDGGVATVIINRPEVRNALNVEVQRRLSGLLDELEANEDVRLVVFTGAGEKAFVAGADIAEIAKRTPADAFVASMQRLYEKIENFSKPTIAAVNGYAFGGGHEFALACDIRIASENAVFGLPETTLGIIPAAGGTQRLARIIGRGRATEIILTGRRISATEAHNIGLVSSVALPDELMNEVEKTAKQVLSNSPLATNLAKQIIRHGFDADQSTGMLLERLGQAVMYASADRDEGTAAFFEKRAADFNSINS